MRRPIVIDHVGLLVSDLRASAKFYEAVLRPLGFGLLEETDDACHFGLQDLGDFTIYASDKATDGAHVGFLARRAEAVDRFFEAGIATGGTERLPPAVRTEYHQHYYAAFLSDPDGNNVEAVYYGRRAPDTCCGRKYLIASRYSSKVDLANYRFLVARPSRRDVKGMSNDPSPIHRALAKNRKLAGHEWRRARDSNP